MVTAYNQAFYFTSGSRGYFRNTTDGGTTWFWGRANEMEMLIDLYEHDGNPAHLAQFQSLYNGFVADYGANWIWNEYNDDIMWMVIACARAYQKTGNSTYLNAARSNFDSCYARAWSADLGGGLWWKSPLNTSKNACVNGPAAIAAYLIYQSTGNTNYLNKSREIFLWERANLFNPANGQIYDSMYYTGSKDQTPITYNQGTFIGAAHLLGYTNDAILAANYTRGMGTGGLLPEYDEHNDLGGFNGIFVRWMVKFMRERNLQSTYQFWLQQNANAAWNVRRPSDNLSWTKWWQQTPAGTRYSFGCWGSVLILNLVPPTQNPGGPVVFLNASDAANASSFVSALNWSSGEAPSWTTHYVVANGRTLRTPADGAHHGFAGSSLTLSNAAVLAIKSTTGNRYITVGTELILDHGQVANWAGTAAHLGGKLTLRSGGGSFDPQGNSLTIPAIIGGTGELRVTTAPSSPTGGTLTFSGVNTYTGGTSIEAPHQVQLNGAGTLGAAAGGLSFSNHLGRGWGTLNLNGVDLTVGALQGTGGVIRNNKSGTTNVFRVGQGDASGQFGGAVSSGSGVLALHKVGTGTLVLSGMNSYQGGTWIAAGTLQLGDGVTRLGSVAGTITNQATLSFANPGAQSYTGIIHGNGRLRKAGPGSLFLYGAHTYTGETSVDSGVLALVGHGAISRSANIFIASGATLDVSGRGDRRFLLQNGQTLSGSGVIVGNLHTGPGSSLQLNAEGPLRVVGDAEISGAVWLRLNRAQANPSGLHCFGALQVAGSLNLIHEGPALEAGDHFQIFNQAVSGMAALNLPALAPNLAWANRLALDGTVQVVAATVGVPARLEAQAGEEGLILKWPDDHVGVRLETSTNLLDWTELLTGRTNTSLKVPRALGDPNAFYRLAFP